MRHCPASWAFCPASPAFHQLKAAGHLLAPAGQRTAQWQSQLIPRPQILPGLARLVSDLARTLVELMSNP